ncbi:MAG TPA: hypothetical protein VKX96_00820, partial [Chloroflexota bacterium]|nr:hypothetical protein [Chloroflexota bacterium]
GNANAGQGANGQANVNRGILLTMTNGKLTPVPVTLGLTDGSITEIDSGVQAGEEIVVGQTGGQTGTGGANVGRPAGGPPGGAFFVGR